MIFTLLSIFSFTSCENSLWDNLSKETFVQGQPQNPGDTDPSKGSIKIKLNDLTKSRTVLPKIDYDLISDIKLTGEFEGVQQNLGNWILDTNTGTNAKDQLEAETITIKAGEWTFTVLATYSNGCTFSDTQTTTINAATVNYLSFTLTSDTSDGGLSISLSYTGADACFSNIFSCTSLSLNCNNS